VLERLRLLARVMDERGDSRMDAARILDWADVEARWRDCPQLRIADDVLAAMDLSALAAELESWTVGESFERTHREAAWTEVRERWFGRHVELVQSEVDAAIDPRAPRDSPASGSALPLTEVLGRFEGIWQPSELATRADDVHSDWVAQLVRAAHVLVERDIVGIQDPVVLDAVRTDLDRLRNSIEPDRVDPADSSAFARRAALVGFHKRWLEGIGGIDWKRTPTLETLERAEAILDEALETWSSEYGIVARSTAENLGRSWIERSEQLLRSFGRAPDRYSDWKRGRPPDVAPKATAGDNSLDALNRQVKDLSTCVHELSKWREVVGDSSTLAGRLQREIDETRKELAVLDLELAFRNFRSRVGSMITRSDLRQAESECVALDQLLRPRSVIGDPVSVLQKARIEAERDKLLARLRELGMQNAARFPWEGALTDDASIRERIARLVALPGTDPPRVEAGPLDLDATLRDWSEFGLSYVRRNEQGAHEFLQGRSGIVFVLVSGREPRVNTQVVAPFLIAKYEVSKRVWDDASRTWDRAPRVSARPGEAPATGVSWNDAIRFCERLGFALPTGSQWRFACGQVTGSADLLRSSGWFKDDPELADGRATPQPVGTKAPNWLGIHDMVANVREWARDDGETGVERQTRPRRLLLGGSCEESPVEWLRLSTADPGGVRCDPIGEPTKERESGPAIELATAGLRPVMNLPFGRDLVGRDR